MKAGCEFVFCRNEWTKFVSGKTWELRLSDQHAKPYERGRDLQGAKVRVTSRNVVKPPGEIYARRGHKDGGRRSALDSIESR